MKRFIINIAIWAVALYALAWGLDYVISTGQTMIDGYPQQVWREIRSGGIDADVVILGTSRGLEHYDPYILDSITGQHFYNLGIRGTPMNVGIMKYNCYCLHNKAPKYILIDIDYLWLEINNCVRTIQSEQYLPLIYERKLRDQLLKQGYSWLDVNIPLYRYWGYQMEIKRGIFEYFHLQHYSGCCKVTKGHIEDPDVYDPNRLIFPDSIPSSINMDAQVLFEYTLSKWIKLGAKIILVTSPRYYLYSEKLKHNMAEKQYILDISQKYNIPFLDYSTNYWMCYDAKLFNSGSHLTPQGTKIFSREVGEALNEYLK